MGNGALSASQIYEQITGGPGPARLHSAGEGAAQLRQLLSEAAGRVNALHGRIGAGWQGAASEAAASAATPLADAAAKDADLLTVADQAIVAQGDAFGTVRGTVVPVPPNPPAFDADDFTAMVNSGTNSHQAKMVTWLAQSQANVDAFNAYHQASTANGQTMPSSYAPLVDPGAPIAMADQGPAKGFDGGERPGGGGVITPPGGPGARQQHGPGPQQSGPQPAPSPGPAPTPGPGAEKPDDSTRSAGATPPKTPPAFGDQPGRPPALGSPPPVTSTGPGTGGGLLPGYRGGFTGGPGTTGGPGGVAGRAGGPVAGPGGRLTGGGELGAAGRTGPAGAAGASGRPGAMPMGGAPMAGRGEKEEDKEHQRAPYVKGEDPEELFGGDIVKPVPATIGESKPQDR
ncbi:PPE domain-containing protein [Amycolatopsis suaedae]|nr:hypothetical protein [Amycolatopsis suaedae]